MYGKNNNPANHHLRDLTRLEYWQLVPLTIVMIWIGMAPRTVMSYAEQSVRNVVQNIENITFTRTAHNQP